MLWRWCSWCGSVTWALPFGHATGQTCPCQDVPGYVWGRGHSKSVELVRSSPLSVLGPCTTLRVRQEVDFTETEFTITYTHKTEPSSGTWCRPCPASALGGRCVRECVVYASLSIALLRRWACTRPSRLMPCGEVLREVRIHRSHHLAVIWRLPREAVQRAARCAKVLPTFLCVQLQP